MLARSFCSSVRRVVRGNKQGTLSVLRFTLARPHLLIFVLVPLLFTNVVRFMFYVLGGTFCVLCFMFYVLRVVFYVTSWSNTRARMVVTQHHLSPSAHIRLNHKEHPEIEMQWLLLYPLIVI